MYKMPKNRSTKKSILADGVAYIVNKSMLAEMSMRIIRIQGSPKK